jgi:uncharacterized protein (TIGR03083 family)
MAGPSPWPTIHSERGALADDLAGLTDAQWKTPTLCESWDVHQLVGHIVATANMTPPRFFGKFIGSGFNFDKMAAKEVDETTAGGPAATLESLRQARDRSTSPPGPVESWLGETIIHSEDIRRPLGISHSYPTDAVVRVLDFYKKSNLIVGAKKRIAGVTLRATDADWSAGTGPEAAGPAVSLLLAMTGRSSALSDLSGEGVGTLRSRM